MIQNHKIFSAKGFVHFSENLNDFAGSVITEVLFQFLTKANFAPNWSY